MLYQMPRCGVYPHKEATWNAACNSVPPLAIAKIAPDTLAAADLRLRVGMALVELQGESTTGMPYDMVIAKIRQAGRPLSMVFEHTWISSGA